MFKVFLKWLKVDRHFSFQKVIFNNSCFLNNGFLKMIFRYLILFFFILMTYFISEISSETSSPSDQAQVAILKKISFSKISKKTFIHRILAKL